jgi:outer membrane protein assembly factor BamB
MAAYQLTVPASGDPFLTQKWTAEGGTSPIVANSTVYYMSGSNKLLALDAVTGASIVSGTSSWGAASFSGEHWQSPILVNGRVYLVDSHSPAQVWVFQLDGAFKSGFE